MTLQMVFQLLTACFVVWIFLSIIGTSMRLEKQAKLNKQHRETLLKLFETQVILHKERIAKYNTTEGFNRVDAAPGVNHYRSIAETLGDDAVELVNRHFGKR